MYSIGSMPLTVYSMFLPPVQVSVQLVDLQCLKMNGLETASVVKGYGNRRLSSFKTKLIKIKMLLNFLKCCDNGDYYGVC